MKHHIWRILKYFLAYALLMSLDIVLLHYRPDDIQLKNMILAWVIFWINETET